MARFVVFGAGAAGAGAEGPATDGTATARPGNTGGAVLAATTLAFLPPLVDFAGAGPATA